MNGMNDLKAHPFFKGIDFNKLHLLKAPIDQSTTVMYPLREQNLGLE